MFEHRRQPLLSRPQFARRMARSFVVFELFATAYALFSGVFFLVACGLVLAPVVHRFLHRFHVEG